jgi:hypothetical protein
VSIRKGNETIRRSSVDIEVDLLIVSAFVSAPKIILPFVPLNAVSVHEEQSSTISLFDIWNGKSNGKLFVVGFQKLQKDNRNFSIFECELEDERLQMFHFDPFLIGIFGSFASHCISQVFL